MSLHWSLSRALKHRFKSKKSSCQIQEAWRILNHGGKGGVPSVTRIFLPHCLAELD